MTVEFHRERTVQEVFVAVALFDIVGGRESHMDVAIQLQARSFLFLSGIVSLAMLFEAAKFKWRFLPLFVVSISIASSQTDPDNFHLLKDAAVPESWSPFSSVESTRTIKSEYKRPQRRLLALQDSCFVPPEPANGVRVIHQHDCVITGSCDISEGVELPPGRVLNYTCNPGYKLVGSSTVVCKGMAQWSQIPECVAVECSSLNSGSLIARCFRHGRWVDCNSSILHGTRAKVSCRPGYLPATSSKTIRSDTVECSNDGKWVPDPIECVPACGVAMDETATDFPWRASLYRKNTYVVGYARGYDVDYFCSATIIRNNLVLTSANDLYDENTNSTVAANDLVVMTGNSLQPYDHPLHETEKIWRSAVKNVYVHCDFRGRFKSGGNIALVELKDPFEFTSFRLPACLEGPSDVEDPIEPDAYGSVVDYGVTLIGGRPTRQIFPSKKSLPYLPHEKCETTDKVPDKSQLIGNKFCTGSLNSSTTVCIQTEGGGLVFKKHGLWYVIGVVMSVPAMRFYNGEYGCEDLAVLANVTQYTAWIAEVIYNLERYQSHPPCDSDGSSTPAENPATGGIVLHEEDLRCSAPPQPANGRWVFHKSLCSNDQECEILRGSPLQPGTQLSYECASGYRAIGSTEVYCGFNGNWSAIPVCVQIKCESLNSVSTAASCYDRFNELVNCDSAVVPETRAEVSCHLGYRMETSFATFRRATVKCSENGRWTPLPIRCVPVCGVANTRQTPYIINGVAAKLSDFPWHSTLYLQKDTSGKRAKEFICGGTIIQNNFVLTAAHCVYDETTKTTTDPSKLFVVTGNIFRDYDSPFHNPASVKKTRVKNIFRPCEYYGVRGNYASDIALLEIETPFVFSSILSPVCLDVEDYSTQILEPGAEGRVAGFGRTAAGESSGILQTLTLPYIPYNQCVPKNKEKNDILFSKDKFCAGYTNGSAVCEGDSGGGLVFRKSEQWYVLGIVSLGLNVDLDNGERTCDKYAYSLYTKVSEHMTWIQDVMYQRARNNIYPPCDNEV